MKSVALVFTHPPHGNSAGREGLDALLAISAISENTGVFFIADGIFQLLNHQQPEKILARNYIATFGILALYDIEACYICAASLRERGMQPGNEILQVNVVEPEALCATLAQYQQILTF